MYWSASGEESGHLWSPKTAMDAWNPHRKIHQHGDAQYVVNDTVNLWLMMVNDNIWLIYGEYIIIIIWLIYG